MRFLKHHPHVIKLFVLLFISSNLYAQEKINKYCPVITDELAIPKHQAVYADQTIYFCCASCIEDFEANPLQYIKNLPENYIDKNKITQSTGNSSSASDQRSLYSKSLWSEIRNQNLYTISLVLGVTLILTLLFQSAKYKNQSPKFLKRKNLLCAASYLICFLLLTWFSFREILKIKNTHRKEAYLISIHAATFYDNSYPPIPEPNSGESSLSRIYYRGNDERSSSLFNNGVYRTCTFYLSIVDKNGVQIKHLEQVDPQQVFLKIHIVRAPGTTKHFFKKETIDNIFLTIDKEKDTGKNGLPEDSIKLHTDIPQWEYSVLYPLKSLYKPSLNKTTGIVYIRELRRFFGEIEGSRFHYGVNVSLNFDSSNLLEKTSNLYMGSLYRSKSLPLWAAKNGEWFSEDPIPVIQGENTTTDPKLLGIPTSGE